MSFFGRKSFSGGRVAFNENFTWGGDPLSLPPPPINSCMVIALRSAWTVHDKIARFVSTWSKQFQQRHLYRRDHEAKQKLLLNARGKKAYHILSTIEAKSREKALSK